jgi:hypothetical protein
MATWLYIHTTSRNLPFPRDFIRYHYDMTCLLASHRIKSANTSQARFYVALRCHFPSSLGYLSSLKAKFPPKKTQTALATATEGVTALHLNTLPFSPLKATTRCCFAPISATKIQHKKYIILEIANGTRLGDCLMNTWIKLSKSINSAAPVYIY